MPRFRAKGGGWWPSELGPLIDKTPQFVNAQIRAGKYKALASTGRSPLIPHAEAAAIAGMTLEDAEAAWPACAEEAERKAAVAAAKDKRNQQRPPRQTKAKPKPASKTSRGRRASREVQPAA